MNRSRRLLCILAHPDDESLGTGGILAKYAVEGVETYLVTATRGERGWFGKASENPGLQALGELRERELRNAANALSVKETILLDYIDGSLEQADSQEVIQKLTLHIRRIKPDVVVTFDPFGAYGHPDHIAISRLTTAALIASSSANFVDRDNQEPHEVQKLYYLTWTREKLAEYQEVFGDLVMHVRGEERRTRGWADWSITTRINTSAHWQRVRQAITCHKTQFPDDEAKRQVESPQYQRLYDYQTFYLAFSLGKQAMDQIEDDLFTGIG